VINYGGFIMNLHRILTIISLLILTGCGLDGSLKTTTPPTVITGVASKGVIVNGTVTVYALNADGSKNTKVGESGKLGTGTTDSKGSYSITIGNYTGAVVVEAYGDYTDEATATPMSVSKDKPLRAALANASGTVSLDVTASTSTSLSVTPLTELAVRQAEQSGGLSATNISAANTLVSDLFKVDIIATAPVPPTASDFGSSTTSQAQKDYAIVLAAVSQMMQTGGKTLEATLTTLNTGIDPATKSMDPVVVTQITTAVDTFIASPKNDTGVTTTDNTSLKNIGLATLKLTVVLQGSSAASVKGIQASITLPADVVLRADASGGILDGVLTAATTAPANMIEGKYASATTTVTFGFITSGSMAAGNVLILATDVKAGVSAPAAAAFALGTSRFVDADGKDVSGASLVLQ
jgi:hypothetical protein